MAKVAELKASSLELFKTHILTSQPLARLSPSGRELQMRCPFCGDSDSNRTKLSFSINVDPNSDNFLRYQCFRASCLQRGVINRDFFEMIEFNQDHAVSDITEYMAARMVKIGGKYVAKKRKSLVNVINTLSPVSDKKLEYINNRLGLNLTYQDIYKLKINLDFCELLTTNGLEIPYDKQRYYGMLSDYGISFISAYNDFVIIRDISKSQLIGKRYTNMNIFQNYDNVTKCYSIPRSIDLLDPEPCVINISEGAFDIIGVYYHLKIDRKYKNQVFLAACGGGIVNTIKAFIKQYGLINVKINIFSDADVPIEKYNEVYKLKKYVTDFKVHVYYNALEKDFGVPKDKINIIKSTL